jgi:hypothetical protein
MQKELDEFGALLSKLRLDDEEMSIETYIQMEGELSTDELVDVALKIDYA